MVRFKYVLAAMAAVFAVGCVADNLAEQQVAMTVLTADVHQTKTVLQNGTKVMWTDGDRVNVNGVESASLQAGEPSASASFTFQGILKHPYKAVFPASIYKNENTVTLPSVQTYKSGTFAESASPLAAYQVEGNNLRFGNLCSVIKLNVNIPSGSKHNEIAYVEFSGKNSEQVCGDFSIDHQAVTLSGLSSDEDDRMLKYEVRAALPVGVTSMYIVVPALDYQKGYAFRVVDVKGHYMDVSKKSAAELQAGELYDMPAFDFVPTGTLMSGGISALGNISGVVRDSSGNPLADVVVSDGLNCVKTDENGCFKLNSDLQTAKFVIVSIPSGYSAPVQNGLPIFFKRLSEQEQVNGKYSLEFVLDKMTSDPARYTLLIAADPQPRPRTYSYDKIGYHSLDCCDDLYLDMREKGAEIMQSNPCYGIVLGDVVHEAMDLFDTYITNGMSRMGFPTFNVIGNHDHDSSASDDVEGARVFEQKLCPANYSFNLGNIHYVVLDNLIMQIRESDGKLHDYTQGLRDDIMQWLRADLSFVDKSTPIMVCAHSPMFRLVSGTERSDRSDTKNGKAYAELLSSFDKVYAWAGHTHVMFNYIYDSSSNKRNIEVHTISRSTGELWTNEYLSEGTPRGYVVVDVNGKDVSWKFRPNPYQTGKAVSTTPDYSLRAWNYKNGVAVMKADGTGLDDSYQMNVYPRGAYGDKYVYANVFMWDENWGTPVYISSDGAKSVMSQVSRDTGFMYDAGQKGIYDFYKANSKLSSDDSYSWSTSNTRSIFRVYSDKTHDTGRVEVTDRFGNVYSTSVSW